MTADDPMRTFNIYNTSRSTNVSHAFPDIVLQRNSYHHCDIFDINPKAQHPVAKV